MVPRARALVSERIDDPALCADALASKASRAVGYSDVSTSSRAFRRLHEVPPSAWLVCR